MLEIEEIKQTINILCKLDKDPHHVAIIDRFEDGDIVRITFSKDNTMCADFYIGKNLPYGEIYSVYTDEKFFDSKNEHFNNFFSAVKSSITTCKDKVSAIKLLVSDVKSFLEKWKEFDNE
jgi:hypothetical protein